MTLPSNPGSKTNPKRTIILFLHSSSGELNIGLPILWKLKQEERDCEIIFASLDPRILASLKIDSDYQDIMSKIGPAYFGHVKTFLLLLRQLCTFRPTILMCCFTGARRIERLFYFFLPKSLLLFFPHASTPHARDNETSTPTNGSYYERTRRGHRSRFGGNSFLLINNAFEVAHFINCGWSEKHIVPVGAICYTQEWLSQLQRFWDYSDRISGLTIFVPLRPAHPTYLSQENYEYQMFSLVQVVEQFPNFHFILKTHPRQGQEEMQKFLKYQNVSLSSKSPLQLCHTSDLVLGFWTSVVLDAAALRKPSIEFHRHEVLHPQILIKDGRKISIHAEMQVCKHFESQEEVASFLKECDEAKLRRLGEEQHENLMKAFSLERPLPSLSNLFNYLFREAATFHRTKIKDKLTLFLN
jgi:hypothetical protein